MNNMGFTSFLQLMFIGLKLTGYLTWSWWWVMSPTLITLTLAISVGSLLFAYYMWFESPEDRTKRLLSQYLKR